MRRHLVQLAPLPPLNPGLHTHWLLLVDPAGADELPGHTVHEADPGTLVYDPVEQLVQTEERVAPVRVLYVPASH